MATAVQLQITLDASGAVSGIKQFELGREVELKSLGLSAQGAISRWSGFGK